MQTLWRPKINPPCQESPWPQKFNYLSTMLMKAGLKAQDPSRTVQTTTLQAFLQNVSWEDCTFIISTLPMFASGADVSSSFTGMDPGRGRSEFLLRSCPLFWQLFSCTILLQVSEKDKRLARTNLIANTYTLVNLQRKRRKRKINVPL